jgi:glutathione S-transferase
MILYHFSNAWGFDPSPFCLKVQAYLRLADIPFEGRTGLAEFRRAPRKQLPYINDDGVIVADSQRIIEHVKAKHGDRLDQRLTPEQVAIGHAVSRMLEGGTYWIGVYSRWFEEETWKEYQPVVLGFLPALIRPILSAVPRREYLRRLRGIGLACRPSEEIYELGRRDIAAVAGILADKPFLLGDRVSSFDL